MATENNSLVEIRGLTKIYTQHRWLSRERFVVPALEGVDLTLRAGTTLALVGESGSGKSTLARCLALLEEPTSGEIWLEGRKLMALPPREKVLVRPRIQLIFQDPVAAINPRLRAADVVAEPLVIQGRGTNQQQEARALELLEQVGLSVKWADRLPAEFSGGQRQRLAIARALALEPKLLILDEALSALDLSIQAQIIRLLWDLQAARGLAYLLVAHDLGLVSRTADEVAVMHRGRIVERAAAPEIFTHPQHPHTQELLDAVPRLP